MKRYLFILVIVCSLFISCGNFHSETDVKNVGLPNKVSHIEFWNGGTMIRSYNNANVKLTIEQNHYEVPSLVKPNIDVTFYTYVIECNGVEEKIIDSESLAIIYKE